MAERSGGDQRVDSGRCKATTLCFRPNTPPYSHDLIIDVQNTPLKTLGELRQPASKLSRPVRFSEADDTLLEFTHRDDRQIRLGKRLRREPSEHPFVGERFSGFR